MAHVSDEQHRDERPPHAVLARHAQHQGLGQGQPQVQIRQLRQHNGGAHGHGAGGTGGVRERQVGPLEEEGLHGAGADGEWLEVEEDETVEGRDRGRRHDEVVWGLGGLGSLGHVEDGEFGRVSSGLACDVQRER